ncbi:MAG: CcoQ/FixQ family Cbb3-type cytochrome c oxidase assembly chaperone [Acidobacteriota bacterium]
MYTDILLNIVGIHVFPVISLLIFFVVFTLVIVQVARADRRELALRAALPLDADTAADAALCEGSRR